MIKSEDHKWREIARRLGPPGATGLERGAVFDPDLFEHDANSLRLEAKRLRKDFERGDELAPFECCWRWREAGLDPALLPDWVLDHLFNIAADYFAAGPHHVTPPELLAMPGRERAKCLPSLDKVAELRGTQGKADPWSWRADHARDPYIADLLDALTKWAEEGERIERNATANTLEKQARRNLFVADGREMAILNRSGRLRDEIRDMVGQLFHVPGYGGGEWNKAKAVRRRHGQTSPLSKSQR